MENTMLLYRLPYGKFLHTEWETLEFMRDAGIDLIEISPMNTANSLGEPYSDYPLIWKREHLYDFDLLDRQFEELLSHHPSARFITTVDLNSPLWLTRELSMDSFYNLSDCHYHKQWKELTMNYLYAFLDHCESRWKERVAGYVIACGRTLEWIEHANEKLTTWKVLHFREWCEKYEPREYLPPLIYPGVSHRYDAVYDPDTEANFPAWLRYVNASTADLAIEFITATRSRIRKEARIGIFYSHIRNSGIYGQLDCERVLDTAPPDFVIGAACNRPFAIGGNSGYIGVTEMLRRRKINFLFECDRITSDANLKLTDYFTLSGGIWNGWKNPQEDVAGLKRELGMCMVNRLSFWFFNIWGGMYRAEETRAMIRRAVEVWKEYAARSSGSAAQILLVIDPESNYQLHSEAQIRRFGELENRISAAGLPADTATWEDLKHVDLSRYRLVIFQNLVVMDDTKETLLREKLCCDGRTVVFLHQAGIIRNGAYAPENVERFTGFPEGLPGIHIRKQENWTEVYAPEANDLTETEIRRLANLAGVHMYVQDAAFHASAELLSIHCGTGGVREIRLPFRARRVIEIFDNRVVAQDTDSFTDSFDAPGTNLYFLERD